MTAAARRRTRRRAAVQADKAINSVLAAGVAVVLAGGAVAVVQWYSATDPVGSTVEFFEPAWSRMGRHAPEGSR